MASAEEFIIRLQQQVSGPASAAEAALLKLEAQIRAEQSALTGLEKNLVSAKAKLAQLQEGSGGKVSIDAVNKQRASIAALEEKIGGAKAGLGLLTSQVPAYTAKAQEAAQATDTFGNNFKEAISAAPGWVKVVVVIAAVATALIAASYAAIKFAITMADAARSSRLLNDAAAGSAKGGAELTAVIDDIAGKVPLAKDRIAEMGRQLEIAHLSGRRAQNALEAMATVASAVGDSAAGKLGQIAEQAQKIRRFMVGRYDLEGTGLAFDELAAQVAESSKVTIAQARTMLQRGQLSVDQGLEAMAAAVQKKFGKTVASQMLALATQIDKLKQGFNDLFVGIDLEPFLKGLAMITSLFSQSTVTGRVLKAMVTALFNPLIEQSSVIFPAIRAFLQGLIIGLLVVELAVLKVKKAISNAFGGESKSQIDWVKTAMYAGLVVVGALVGAVGLLVVGLAAVAIVTLPIWGFFVLLGVAIYKVIAAVKQFKAEVLGIGDTAQRQKPIQLATVSGGVDGAAAAKSGANFGDTLAASIASKMGVVAAAAKSLGGAAETGLNQGLLIKSPSRIAIKAATNVTSTFADTLEDGQSDTRAAFNNVVDPKALKGPGTGPRGGGDTYGPFYLEYHGTKEDGDDFISKFKRTLEAMKGEGPLPAPT